MGLYAPKHAGEMKDVAQRGDDTDGAKELSDLLWGSFEI